MRNMGHFIKTSQNVFLFEMQVNDGHKTEGQSSSLVLFLWLDTHCQPSQQGPATSL